MRALQAPCGRSIRGFGAPLSTGQHITRDAGSRLDTPPRASTSSWVLAGGCVALVAGGWGIHEESYIRPDEGLGYQLGIVGAVAMLFILAYSARKRVSTMAAWGSMQQWFHCHMILGVVGPVLILLHANFQLGSANSSVALVSMLLVAGSGVVGRFLYLKIHHGLYGGRAQLRELLLFLTRTQSVTRPLLEVFPEVVELLADFEARHTAPPRSSAGAIWRLLTARLRTNRLRRRCFAHLDLVLWEERRATRLYTNRLHRVVSFTSWERLFRLWHAVHVPLSATLLVTVVLHVIAVHMY